MKRAATYVIIAVIIANIALLFSGYRILIGERIVQPGEHYVAGQWGDLAGNEQASIVCTYWTGRNSKLIVWWYGGDFMSKDECPFLHTVD